MSGDVLALCYHAVSDRWPCELAIPPARLEHQLATLLARGYRAVTFSDAVARASTRAAAGADGSGERLVAVTFDDGYRSLIHGALPVLEGLGIPATAFVPSAFVGVERLAWAGIDQWLEGPFAQELAPVSWDDLRALADAGWEIGSHSCTHPRLTELSDERLAHELGDSRAEIEARLRRSCRALAYPFGTVDGRVVAAARSAGYQTAAALPIRLDHPTALNWPRIGIYRTDGSVRFAVKVSRSGRSLRRTPIAAPMLAAQRLSLAASAAVRDAAIRDAAHDVLAPAGRGPLTRPARRAPATSSPRAPAVLVTDAEERSIVAVTRALGATGYRVAASASSPHAAAQWSRFCGERLRLPDPLRDEQGFVDGIERAVRGGGYDGLIPGSDPALLIASRHRARLEEHVRMGLAPHTTVLRAMDKLALVDAARGTGLEVPETVLCASVEEGIAAARALGFPVALKPRSSVFEVDGALRHMPGRMVHDEAELAHAAPAYGERYLLQRNQPGELLAYGGVFAGGQLLASALARSWRTHRPDSGSLAFCEAIAVPASLRASVAELLRNVGHQGIFELDLVARADRRVALLDLNPRPYGALALAVRGGANLPKIWCDWLLGRTAREAAGGIDAAPGVFFRWEDADLFHLACRVRRREARQAAAVLAPHRHVAHAYFAASDPGPFVARLLWLAEDFASNGFADRRERGLRGTR